MVLAGTIYGGFRLYLHISPSSMSNMISPFFLTPSINSGFICDVVENMFFHDTLPCCFTIQTEKKFNGTRSSSKTCLSCIRRSESPSVTILFKQSLRVLLGKNICPNSSRVRSNVSINNLDVSSSLHQPIQCRTPFKDTQVLEVVIKNGVKLHVRHFHDHVAYEKIQADRNLHSGVIPESITMSTTLKSWLI